MTAALPPGEVHLWFVQPSTISTSERIRLREWLDPDERARMKRFVRDADRHSFVVAHALVRRVLADAASCGPAAWRFQRNEWGRPEVLEPPEHRDLAFNLSHTRDLAVCALARDCRLGVDVEDVTRQADDRRVSASYFSPEEVADLDRRDGEARRLRFFEYWTYKEAFIKAHGRGMSLPLDRFTIHINEAVRVSFGPDVDGDPDSWFFAQARPTADHVVAVAAQSPVLQLHVRAATLAT